jgi:endonuclease-8
VVEGPTAKAYAVRISAEFGGEAVRRVFARSLRRFHVPPESLVGKRFCGADSIGKNILLFFDGLAVRLHLMMYGTIHIYRLEEGLLKPEGLVRLMIEGERRRLVAYNAPIVEADEARRLLSRLKEGLGPDPLSSDWSRRRALENLLKLRDEKVGVALLNQSVIAGIGNILRNEILFRARVNPERRVGGLTEAEAERILEACEELSREFLRLKVERRRIKPLLLVYNKYRGRCPACGGPLKFYLQEPIRRKTFICPSCQR